MDTVELEGTWEEMLARSSELSGHRVRITVISEHAPSAVDEAAEKWADEAERLELTPGPLRHGDEAELEQALVEKYRRQGLDL